MTTHSDPPADSPAATQVKAKLWGAKRPRSAQQVVWAVVTAAAVGLVLAWSWPRDHRAASASAASVKRLPAASAADLVPHPGAMPLPEGWTFLNQEDKHTRVVSHRALRLVVQGAMDSRKLHTALRDIYDYLAHDIEFQEPHAIAKRIQIQVYGDFREAEIWDSNFLVDISNRAGPTLPLERAEYQQWRLRDPATKPAKRLIDWYFEKRKLLRAAPDEQTDQVVEQFLRSHRLTPGEWDQYQFKVTSWLQGRLLTDPHK